MPEKGPCRFTVDEMSTAGFQFDIAYQCTACFVGTFSVPPAVPNPPSMPRTAARGSTPAAPSRAPRSPPSACLCDNLQPIRDVAGAWAPVTGPQHVDVAGFSCDRIGESIGGAPTATYRCVKGAQYVSLITTGRS